MNTSVEALAPAFVPAPGSPTVGLVITTYNHAHFLSELSKASLPRRGPDAIIVVDDGSTTTRRGIVGRYPGVRLVRQDNMRPRRRTQYGPRRHRPATSSCFSTPTTS